MKVIMVALVALAATGCSKNEQPAEDNSAAMTAPSDTAAADNTARNQPSQPGSGLTPGDQSENAADRAITQQIRQQVVKGDQLSMDAKNVKIVTVDGVVTLRGPVKSEQERMEIGSTAQRVDGVKRVNNELEIAAK